MIDLYTWPTPNGRKISIMLEETGINYTVFPVNIGKDDQFQPNFLKIFIIWILFVVKYVTGVSFFITQ